MTQSGRISVCFDVDEFGPSKRFEFKSGLLEAAAIYAAIRSSETEEADKQLPMHVKYLDGSIIVSCGKLTKMKVPVVDLGEEFPAALLYAICIVCFDLVCAQQAPEAARSIAPVSCQSK